MIGFIVLLGPAQHKGQSHPSEELLGVVDVDELVAAYVRTRVCMGFRKRRPNETVAKCQPHGFVRFLYK